MNENPSRAKILIIDEHVDIANDLEIRLKKLGYGVQGKTDSAREAMALCETVHPDLVLMDVGLNGNPNSIESARVIWDCWNIPVVLIDENTDRRTSGPGKPACPFGCILKPFHDGYLEIIIEMALGAAREAQDRGRIEKELKDARQLQNSVDLSRDGMVVLEQNGKFFEANRIFADMLGYSQEELNQLHVWDWAPLWPKDSIYKTLTVIKENGNRLTTNHLCKDGKTHRVEISTKGALRENSELFFYVCREITNNRLSQKALRESEERFIAMFEHMGSGVAIYEAVDDGDDFLFKAFNSAAEKITKINRKQALGKRLLDLFPHMEKSGLVAALRRVWKTGHAEHIPPFYYQDDVREGWRENRLYKLPSGEVVALFNDVTERLIAEEQLKYSQANLNALIENIDDVMVSRESDGRVIVCNSAFQQLSEKITGNKKLQNKDFMEPLPEECKRTWNEAMKKVLAGEKSKQLFTWDFGNGDTRKYEISYNPIVKDDEIVGTAEHIKDITEFHNNEQKLQASLKEKDVLLKELHHRVKNNMQVIVSLMNLQSRKINDPKLKSVFLESQNRIHAMAAVHETLYQSHDLSTIDLEPYITKLCQSTFQSYKTDTDSIQLLMSVGSTEVLLEQAYPVGLVVTELLSNALKHAFKKISNGKIGIEGGLVSPDMVQLIVHDNGVGFPDSMDWRSTDSLGLQIVRNLIEKQLRGSIAMISENGTRFEITFPV